MGVSVAVMVAAVSARFRFERRSLGADRETQFLDHSIQHMIV